MKLPAASCGVSERNCAPAKLESIITSDFISLIAQIYEPNFMFICSFIGIYGLTIRNYNNFYAKFYWNIFCK